ncbi:MAG: hypothetical protein PHW39_07285 [Syntrophomonadaceae bacterium]|nr:hypothetical protein [Syntrophomonadaceae bacterium]
MTEYEIYFREQPLYCNAFLATKAMEDLYLQAPAWVKTWMEALDALYDS